MEYEHVNSKDINPLNSRQVDSIAVLKQVGVLLRDSVGSRKKGNTFCTQMLKLLKEGKRATKTGIW